MDFRKLASFLTKLKANNNKEWFEANRKEYEALRKDWIEFVAKLIKGISTFDPAIAGLDAKSTIFRINRDIRFSNDKSPYKTNFGSSMSPGGKKGMHAGYYFHVDPKEAFVAGGTYMPEPNVLAAIRQEIDYDPDGFKKIVEGKAAKKYFKGLEGEKLSRPPKGYEADNPAIEYIKHKSFIFSLKLSPKELLEKDIEKKIVDVCKAIKPLNDFLNKAEV